jgi:kynureninase
LNSGAGGIGGIFINEKHTEKGGNSLFPMLQGWWGNNIKTKFLMKDGKHYFSIFIKDYIIAQNY